MSTKHLKGTDYNTAFITYVSAKTWSEFKLNVHSVLFLSDESLVM